MPEKRNPHRERIEDLGRKNTEYTEAADPDWTPGDPPHLDHYDHGRKRQIDDEYPDLPDRD